MEAETQMHIFTCTDNLVDINMCRDRFVDILIDQINNIATKASCKDLRACIDSIKEIESKSSWVNRDPDEFSFIDLLFCLIPKTLYESILFITMNRKETLLIIEGTMEKFTKYIRTNVWARRCKTVKRWELDNGIKNMNKRKVLTTPTNITVNLNNSNDNKNDHNNNNNRDKKQLKNICINIVNKYIAKLVQCNMFWTKIFDIGCSAGP